jgi:hypothetical protein
VPATEVRLDRTDAMEFGQMLTFIHQWISGPDKAQLAASLHRFIDLDGYELTELRTDLARFTFLLREDDGEQLFGTDQPVS